MIISLYINTKGEKNKMQKKEEFEKLVDNLREKLDDTTKALVSEELLATLSAYNNGYDEYEKMTDEVEKLKSDKEELLKVNGQLYQRIGFDKPVEKEEETEETKEETKIEEVINEKGELI